MVDAKNVFTRVRDGFFHTLPDDVANLSDQPFYIAVAMWGLRRGTLLTSESVSRAFSITQGRARDIIHYISHEGGKHIICEKLILQVGSTRRERRRALKIIYVEIIPDEVLRSLQKRGGGRTRVVPDKKNQVCRKLDETQFGLLRRWMCQRRVGDVWESESAGRGFTEGSSGNVRD